jgi:hypothetical protein
MYSIASLACRYFSLLKNSQEITPKNEAGSEKYLNYASMSLILNIDGTVL